MARSQSVNPTFSSILNMFKRVVQLLLPLVLLLSVHLLEAQELSHGKRLLMWEDFRAEAPGNSHFAAYTMTRVNLESAYTGRGKLWSGEFKVEAVFLPEKSWVRNDRRSRSERVLAHEQLHFDIAELSARKLRKALSELPEWSADLKQRANKLFEQCVEEGEQMQKRYDKETNHGLDSAAQERWKQWVEAELQKMSAFRN